MLPAEFTVPNRKYVRILLIGMLFWVVLEELLISMLSFPNALRYLNDVMVLAMTVYILPEFLRKVRCSGFTAALWAVIVYSAVLLIGIIRGGVSVLLVLWAVRNTFRFFAFFAVCICLLRREDMERILQCAVWLQIPNLALALLQFLVLKCHRDNIGGIFGNAEGANAYLNIYFCVILAYVFCRYLTGKDGIIPLLLTAFGTMLICGFAEIKIVFIELFLIAAAAICLNKLSKKSLVVAVVTVAAFGLGMLIMRQLYRYHYNAMSSLENILSYANQEDGGYNLSRLHAFEKINELFFHGDAGLNLFGFGFGNCEASSFSFLTSAFYRENGHWNYRWFTHQMMFLETGYLGLIGYIGILGTIVVCCLQKWKALTDNREMWCLSIIMALLTIANLFYNSAIRAETAYLVYFSIAAAPVCVLSAAEKGAQDAE